MVDIAVCLNPGAGLPDQAICGRSKRGNSLTSGREFNNYLGHLLLSSNGGSYATNVIKGWR